MLLLSFYFHIMNMNDQTKLRFALEHVAHLEDLFEGNEWHSYLMMPLSTIKYECERQLKNIELTKNLK